jgi:GNAT superfamily N-acetyltransferase
MAPITVRLASAEDGAVVMSILREAAEWLESRGIPLWRTDELSDEAIAADVAAGSFWIAEVRGESAGTVRLQFSDPEFWPDVPEADCLFLHRLAVRRQFAGGEVSSALLSFALDMTRTRNRRLLCLDCEADRERLRAIYERFGFTHHSDRHVGPYFVARYTMSVDGRARE